MKPGHGEVPIFGTILGFLVCHSVTQLPNNTTPINCQRNTVGWKYESWISRWGADVETGCQAKCLYKLEEKWLVHGVDGCFSAESCSNCRCTVDSGDIPFNADQVYKEAWAKLKTATNGYRNFCGRRHEGTLYVGYDCRQPRGGLNYSINPEEFEVRYYHKEPHFHGG